MPQSASAPVKLDAAVLSAAFEALKAYDQGSSRAVLVPIDDAVVVALADKAVQKDVERQLVLALKNSGSVAAREYACTKLAMIGSKVCVPALAALLDVPEVASAARDALEVIPHRYATGALRKSLPKLQGAQKIGAINSLGARRDGDSVRTLSAPLKDTDLEIAGAATAALGEIGSSRSAAALRKFQPSAPESLRQQVADACLVCAGRLLASGKRPEAAALYAFLTKAARAKHVQQAAASGFERATGGW